MTAIMRSAFAVLPRLIAVALCVSPCAALAEPAPAAEMAAAPAVADIGDIAELSMEDLLNPEVAVASRTPLTMRDAPGIITVVRREEIVRGGFRDLLDILHVVPGFSFGVDVEGVIGVAFRGLWGHEGKVLFLIDGLEFNETLYATMQMFMRMPASQIQRVEIVRGPGSAIYGGYAELAVVNVITRDPGQIDGGTGDVYLGTGERAFGRVMANAGFGREFKNVPGLGVSLQTAYSWGNQTDATYTDFLGNSYSNPADTTRQNLMLNFGAHYKALQLRFIYDDYQLQTRDGYGEVLDSASSQRFESILLDVRYNGQIGQSLKLIPRLFYKRGTPWQVRDQASPLFFDKTADRLLGGLALSWDIRKGLNLMSGVEGFWDHAKVNDLTIVGTQTLFGDKDTVNFGNLAAYAQLIFLNRILNLTVGARYEYHTQFGHSFVPRAGVTKVLGRWNFKLLYSMAFRAPSIENLNINPDIQPERTHVAEAEVGLQLTDRQALTVNGYFIYVDRPIVYTVDPSTSEETYLNADHTGAGGIEALYRLRYDWGSATLSYSYTNSDRLNAVDLYAIPGRGDRLLGVPGHKVALNSHFALWRDHVTLGLNFAVMTPRSGYLTGDENGEPVLGEEPTLLLANVNLAYRNLGLRGLDLSAGIFNFFGQSYRALQPYNAGHAPFPMLPREIFVRLSYNVGKD